jgi:hypothetical protein
MYVRVGLTGNTKVSSTENKNQRRDYTVYEGDGEDQ